MSKSGCPMARMWRSLSAMMVSVVRPEEVELHQARLLDVVLVELAHRGAGAVGAVEGREVGEPARRDEDAARVHADVAREPLERLAPGA